MVQSRACNSHQAPANAHGKNRTLVRKVIEARSKSGQVGIVPATFLPRMSSTFRPPSFSVQAAMRRPSLAQTLLAKRHVPMVRPTRNATLVPGREMARKVACFCCPLTTVPRRYTRCQSCERACTALAVDLPFHPRGAADGGGNCSVAHSTGPSNAPRVLTTGPRAVMPSSCRNATVERLCPRCHFSTGSPW